MLTVDNLHDQIPQYLTATQQLSLVNQLKDFENCNYFTTLHPNDLLQGDGWSGIEVLRFHDGARSKIKGILLSNSCDIDSNNKRDFPARIVFAPLVRIDDYEKALQGKATKDQIDSKLLSIRKQRVSSLFYIPKGGDLDTDYIAILDDLHTIPLAAFEKEVTRQNLFTLSQAGFYLFVFKLSIHFCRFQDGVVR